MSRAALWRAHPVAMTLASLLAALGLALALEGGTRGGALYRGAALGLGGLCLLPLCASLLQGERLLRWSRHLSLSLGAAALVFVAVEVAVRAFGGRYFQAPVLRFDPELGHSFVGRRGAAPGPHSQGRPGRSNAPGA
jgi:hypothetical protein